MEFHKINRDINGNPRYFVYYKELADDKASANKIARELGGKKADLKKYGIGYVFQSYNTHSLEKRIKELQTENDGTLNEIASAEYGGDRNYKVGDIVGNTVEGFNFVVKEIKGNTVTVENTLTGEIGKYTINNFYKPKSVTESKIINKAIQLIESITKKKVILEVNKKQQSEKIWYDFNRKFPVSRSIKKFSLGKIRKMVRELGLVQVKNIIGHEEGRNSFIEYYTDENETIGIVYEQIGWTLYADKPDIAAYIGFKDKQTMNEILK